MPLLKTKASKGKGEIVKTAEIKSQRNEHKTRKHQESRVRVGLELDWLSPFLVSCEGN